jgi:hypothetical protein
MSSPQFPAWPGLPLGSTGRGENNLRQLALIIDKGIARERRGIHSNFKRLVTREKSREAPYIKRFQRLAAWLRRIERNGLHARSIFVARHGNFDDFRWRAASFVMMATRGSASPSRRAAFDRSPA